MNRPLLTALVTLPGCMASVCPDSRPRRDAVERALALLCAEGPKTITNARRWLGRTDWKSGATRGRPPQFRHPAGWETCDTADWKSAVRVRTRRV